MSLWAVATWIAVGVLGVGSLAVFGWFLRDALVMLKERRERR